MFALEPDASKLAFVALVEQLGRWGIPLVDCQVYTPHLARFGAREWPRRDFLSGARGRPRPDDPARAVAVRPKPSGACLSMARRQPAAPLLCGRMPRCGRRALSPQGSRGPFVACRLRTAPVRRETLYRPSAGAADRRVAVVVLGQVAVVGRAQEADVLGTVIPSHAEGVSVVELEPVPRGAASALLVDVTAAVAVALAHRTPDGGGDVARRR